MRRFATGLLFSLMLLLLMIRLLGWSLGKSTPEKIILYSIDGTDRSDKPNSVGEPFHRYPVLGMVEIADPEIRKDIANLVREAMAVRQKVQVKCHWPRHGLSITTNGKTTDYAICFQCRNVKTYNPDSQYTQPFGNQPQEILTRILAEAGVPVAP